MSNSQLLYLLSIPLFVLSMIVEYIWARRRDQQELFNLADTVNNLQLGTGQLLVGLLVKAPLFTLYHTVHQAGGGLGVPSWSMASILAWAIGFLVMDCAYYWFHRLSHEHNFLWAGHAVHHQSEYYNLSVALRQSWIQQCFSGVFYLPLALGGIPVEMFITLYALNTLSQFWIHTQLIDRIGPLEAVLNTPSHHRVHHGVDDDYVDKNYAGALIIWDKLFGTFEPEKEAPRYGVIKPLRSWNPTWANLDIWVQFIRRFGELSLRDRLLLLLRAPAWRGADEAPLQIQLRTDQGYALYHDRGRFIRYATASGLINILGGALFLSLQPSLSWDAGLAWVIVILSSMTIQGMLADGRVYAFHLEFLRLCVMIFIIWFTPQTLGAGGSLGDLNSAQLLIILHVIFLGSLLYQRIRSATPQREIPS